jgi:hypothetical protein
MIVSIPDKGLTVEFPDDMDQEEISSIIRRDIYGETPEPARLDQPAYDRSSVRPNPVSDRSVSAASIPGMMEQQTSLATNPNRIRPMNALVEGGKDVVRGSLNFLNAANEAKARNIEASGNKDLANEIRRQGATDVLYRQLDEKWLKPDGTFKRPEGFKGYVYDVVRMTPQVASQIGVSIAGGPVAGGMFMGTQIAGQTVDNLEKQGVDPERAWKAALANAFSQAPMEQLGIGKALKFWKPGKTASKALRAMVESGGTEFLTEWAQQYPELAARIWAAGEGKDKWDLLNEFTEGWWEATKEGMYQGLVAAPLGAAAGGAGAVSQIQETAEPSIESPEIKTKAPVVDEIREKTLNDLVKGEYTVENILEGLDQVPDEYRSSIEAAVNDFESGRINKPDIETNKPFEFPEHTDAERSDMESEIERQRNAPQTYSMNDRIQANREDTQAAFDAEDMAYLDKLRKEAGMGATGDVPGASLDEAQQYREMAARLGLTEPATQTALPPGQGFELVDRPRGMDVVPSKTTQMPYTPEPQPPAGNLPREVPGEPAQGFPGPGQARPTPAATEQVAETVKPTAETTPKGTQKSVKLYHVGHKLAQGEDMKADHRGLVWFSPGSKYGAGKENVPTTEIIVPRDKILVIEDENGVAVDNEGQDVISATKNGSKSEIFNEAKKRGYVAVQRGYDVSMEPSTASKYLAAKAESPQSAATQFNESTPGNDLKFDGEQDRSAINKPPLYGFTPQSGPMRGRSFSVETPTAEAVTSKFNEMVAKQSEFDKERPFRKRAPERNPIQESSVERAEAVGQTRPQETPGSAWIGDQRRPFINPRQIKRGKNKGKYYVQLTAGRDADGNINPGKRRIVYEKDIVSWPEEAATKPVTENIESKEKQEDKSATEEKPDTTKKKKLSTKTESDYVFHRGSDPKTATNIVLAADDRESVSQYGDNEYAIPKSSLKDVPGWVQKFAEKYYKKQYGSEYDEYLGPNTNPDDIVNSADVWDDMDFVASLWDENETKLEKLIDSGIVGFKTNDGAVILPGDHVGYIVNAGNFDTTKTEVSGAPTDKVKSILKNETGSSQIATDILNYGIELKNSGVETLSKFRREMRERFKDIWEKIKSIINDLWRVINNERGEIKLEKAPDTPINPFLEKFKNNIDAKKESPSDDPSLKESPEPETSKRIWDEFIYQAQDKFNYLNKAQMRAARKKGSDLPEYMDAILAEIRYHGMVGAEIDDSENDHVVPLLDLMSKNGIDSEMAGEYLVARHAKEANAQLKKINLTKDEVEEQRSELTDRLDRIKSERSNIRKAKPDKYPIDKRYKQTEKAMMATHAAIARLDNYTPVEDNTALSGMTDERADEILAEASKSKKARVLDEIGRRVDAITQAQRDLLRQSGLEKDETIDAWEAVYRHYVPLFREGKDASLPKKGRGFDTRGGQKRRAGSTREIDFGRILPQIVSQYQTTIVRSEKAKVGRAFLEFAKANEGPWKVDQVEYAPSFNSDGLVVYRPDPQYRLMDNVMAVRINGEEHHITFDEGDHEAMRIVSALKNLDAETNGILVKSLSKVTRWLAMVNTGLNPEFIITNFGRDIQTAIYNMNDSEAHDIKMKALKDVPAALKGIYQGRRKGIKDTEWGSWYERFRKAGGQTGWVESYSDINARRRSLERQIRRMKPDNFHTTLRGMKAVGDWVNDMNTVVENGIRLSVFKNLVEKGATEAKAARVAKELTVNFNRKGNMGPAINAWKLFYNASIQGTARVLMATKNQKVRRRFIYPTIAFAWALDAINRSVGGDDEDGEPYYDKIPDWVKDRKLIVMLPKQIGGGEGEYFSLPLPWGYNVLHVIGQTLGELTTKKNFKPVDGGLRLARATIDAFNPVGNDISFLQTLAPAPLIPIVQVVENKDWTGKRIHPENDIYNPKPMSELYWSSVREPSRDVARLLNQIGGGNEAKVGVEWLDISPESIDHVVDAVGGGMAKFFARSASAARKYSKGEDIESYEIPFVRQVFGKPGASTLSSDFYENIDTVRVAERQYKHYEDDKEMIKKIIKDNKSELRLGELARDASKEVSELRRQRSELERRGETPKSSDRIRRIDNRIERIMRRFNKKFNARDK